jgi:hypothetical protein
MQHFILQKVMFYNAIHTPNMTQMQLLNANTTAVGDTIFCAADLLGVAVTVTVPISPPTPVGAAPLGMPGGRIGDPRVSTVGVDTGIAPGTLLCPAGMTCTLLVVELNFVCASEICWLSYVLGG